MRRVIALAALLAAAPALAQKPWETAVDLPVPVTVELPALPPANPFAAPVGTAAAPLATPLREKFAQTFTVQAAAYVDDAGTLRRLVFTRTPWPGLEAELRPRLAALAFTPARSGGAPAAVWLPLAVDLKGRIDQGRFVSLEATAPQPGAPPVPDARPTPPPDAEDARLPAVPLARVDQLPNPKRPPRVRVDGRTWREPIRLLAEVSPDGRCRRAVFLTCPDGLRPWLLASMSGWTFRPAAGPAGPVDAWVQLAGEVEVEAGTLASQALRITRSAGYPQGDAPTAAGPPPGA